MSQQSGTSYMVRVGQLGRSATDGTDLMVGLGVGL